MSKAAVALTIGLLFGSAHAEFVAPQEWRAPIAPFHIIDNVYYVGSQGLSSFLITTPQGHVLLDGGMDYSAPMIERNIETLGFKVTDIKYLLNSHAHLDHAGGLAQIKKDSGARLIASAGDKPLLEGGYYPGETGHDTDFPPVTVDRVVQDGGTLTLGGAVLTAHITPGHTPGCTSWTLPVKDAGASHRIIFFCSSTVALNRLVGRPTYPQIVNDYERTFAKSRKIEADIFLAPHPDFFHLQAKLKKMKTGAPNPFIDSAEFHEHLKRSEQDFYVALAKQKAALKSPAN